MLLFVALKVVRTHIQPYQPEPHSRVFPQHAIVGFKVQLWVGLVLRSLNDKMAAARVGGKEDLFIGVDVGTGSVRAGLFTASGTLVGDVAKSEIKTWSENGCLEQSSEDIWSAVCTTVKVSGQQIGHGSIICTSHCPRSRLISKVNTFRRPLPVDMQSTFMLATFTMHTQV